MEKGAVEKMRKFQVRNVYNNSFTTILEQNTASNTGMLMGVISFGTLLDLKYGCVLLQLSL